MYIAPSILAADFARLGELVLQTQAGGANRIHIDVMDGHFVPNLSMGPIVVKALRPVTALPLEVHLMITDPAKYADAFIKEGASSLIVHQEVLPDAKPLLQHIKSMNVQVGLAINPGTPVEVLEPYLPLLDLALCMTVWPGFGGQKFITDSLPRLQKIREMINRINPACELEVDGGIDLNTINDCAKHGANVFVAGTSVFGSKSGPKAAIAELEAKARLA